MSLNLRQLIFQWNKEKRNKIIKFIKSLFNEIDDEIVKFFNKNGLFKVVVLMLLLYIIYHFYPDSVPYTIVALVLILGFLKIKLGESSKISSVIIILGGVALGLVLLGGLWLLIIEPIIDCISTIFN